jgi:hypothetical protein
LACLLSIDQERRGYYFARLLDINLPMISTSHC